MESVLHAIPAERGAIMLVEDEHEEPESFFAVDRANGPGRPVRVSRTVARKVLAEGVSLLLEDVVGHEAYGSAESRSLLPSARCFAFRSGSTGSSVSSTSTRPTRKCASIRAICNC